MQTQQIKNKRSSVNVSFEDVAAVADRMVWTGKLPTADAICEELNARSIDRVRQCLTLWKAGYNHIHAENHIHGGKTRIAHITPELEHLVSEVFEGRITALKAKLKAEYAEIRIDRDRLVKVNEQQAAQIEALMLALGDAEVKIADQARRISRLKTEIAAGRDALAKAEQRIEKPGRD